MRQVGLKASRRVAALRKVKSEGQDAVLDSFCSVNPFRPFGRTAERVIMHELGMVTGVVESVRQAAEANHADKVLKVSLSVGEMTEAIEDALTFAYEAITDGDPLFSGSKLDITMVPPKSRCVECGHEFTHDRFHVMCPECGGFADLIEGKEMRIDSIEVDIPYENEE